MPKTIQIVTSFNILVIMCAVIIFRFIGMGPKVHTFQSNGIFKHKSGFLSFSNSLNAVSTKKMLMITGLHI